MNDKIDNFIKENYPEGKICKIQDNIDVDDKNLCNALAKMLCYLKENNLIKNICKQK